MGLIAESPWTEIGTIYDNEYAEYGGNVVGKSEHNYSARKVPDSAGIDDDGRTTFSLSADILMKPGRSGAFDGDFRNKDADIKQNWDNSGHEYRELAYDPVGDQNLDYDVTAGFTVGTGGTGGSVGVSIDGGKIYHNDKTSNYSLDSKVHHNWNFPGAWECDRARCSEVQLGNVGRIDAKEPYDSIDYCPTRMETTYRDPNLNTAGTSRDFNPTIYVLETYY